MSAKGAKILHTAIKKIIENPANVHTEKEQLALLEFALDQANEIVDLQDFKSGTTFTIADSTAKEIRVYVSSGITSAIIKLPLNLIDKQVIRIYFHGGNVSPISVIPNTGYTIFQNSLSDDFPTPSLAEVNDGETLSFSFNAGQSIMYPSGSSSQQLYEWLANKENTHYPVVSATGLSKTIFVNTDITAQFEVGDKVIMFNADNTRFGKFTVSSKSYSAPNTSILVAEALADISTGSGKYVVRLRLN